MNRALILVVEDEPNLAALLRMELEHEGYEVRIARDGEEALDEIYRFAPDLVLLDWMLPKKNGMQVLAEIRRFSDMPVILLTAKSGTGDKVAGLDAGADDYITKPFEAEELFARIRRILKKQPTSTIKCGGLVADINCRKVTLDGNLIELTPREFDLLVCLMKNAGTAMTREQLLNRVWGYDFEGEEKIVDVYIRYLRAKLKQVQICTVRGVGYLLEKNI